MTSREDLQPETSRNAKIKELLIDLKKTFGIGYGEIATKVGVTDTHISGVINDKRDGGSQLLAGLLLLKELTVLKQSGVLTNPELQKELANMKRRIGEIEVNIQVPYPEHRAGSLILNEEKETVSSDVAAKAAVEAAKMVVAAIQREKKDPPPK